MSQRSSSRSSSSSPPSFLKQLLCVATAVAVFAGLGGGCTRTRVEMVAKYNPGEPARVGRTPEVGVYKIKFAAGPPGAAMHTLHGSKRFLGKGQPVGFVPGEDGEIIAVAGEERFRARLPEDARFCVWYTKSKEPSDFGKGVGDTLAGAGAVTLLVGAFTAALVLKLYDDDDCRHDIDRDDCDECRH